MISLRLYFPIVAVGAVTFLTSQLITEVPAISLQLAGDLNMATIGQGSLYFCLGLVIARYLRRKLMLGALGLFILTVSLCLSIGVSDEFRQMFVTGRNAEFGDLVSDLIGGSLGALLIIVGARRTESLGGSKPPGYALKVCRLGKAPAAGVIVCFLVVSLVVVTGTVPAWFRVLAAEGVTSADHILELFSQREQTDSIGARSSEASEKTFILSVNERIQAKTASTGFQKVDGSLLGYTALFRLGKPRVGTSAAITGASDQAHNARTNVSAKPKDSTTAVPGKTRTKVLKRTREAAFKRQVQTLHRKDHTRYLARFENELAKLEIKELPMIAYSETYYQKVLLKDKIALLRTKISQSQSRADSGYDPQFDQKFAVFSHSGDGSRNHREMMRLSSLSGS